MDVFMEASPVPQNEYPRSELKSTGKKITGGRKESVLVHRKVKQHTIEPEKYKQLYDLSPVGYLTIAKDGTITSANISGALLLGVERDRLVGNRIQNYIYEDYLPQLHDLLHKASNDQINEECEIGLNSNRIIRIVCTTSGGNHECLATLIDITGQKRVEEALAEKKHLLETLNETLEQRIFQAVNELREKDQMLIQQGRLAAMGEMINNIAHQWRQPLNNIGLIVQNLQLSFEMGDLASVDVNKQAANAMEIILHMSRTIDDFRKFFNQDKEKQRFCVQGAVDRVLEFIGPSLRSNCVQVEVKGDPNVCAVGFENEYAQVLLNILANARDAFVERKIAEPKIIIKVSQPKGKSIVTVRDNGGGIAEDILPKIFDPYFTTKKQANSSGIGLYMSKTIIEKKMGGKLSIRNVQEGAEMRIEV